MTSAKKLVESFASVGLCYLQNHGINTDLMDGYMATSRDFFREPDIVKNKYKRLTGKICGWAGNETEKLNPQRPADLKEAFGFCFGEIEVAEGENHFLWPNEELKQRSVEMFDTFKVLAFRLCDCLSLGLGLDKSTVRDAHMSAGAKGSTTTQRTLFYPPIPDDFSVQPGQIRLGEHTDYGTFSLLYQDDIGGLELEVPGQGFLPVNPRADTIVMILGGLFQRWTADRLLAGKHRVVIPEVETKRRIARQSVAFFLQPDNDYVIKPLDGSDKYPPITGWQYIMERLTGIGFEY